MDIFQIEARGLFSPPNGAEPQLLPDYWRETPNAEPRTDLPELSDAELNALGWKGPIEYPDPSYDRVWNTQTREWDLVELSEYDKGLKINYQGFWDQLIASDAYATIKSLAKQSLEVNTIATEFIALFSDAKNGKANVIKIQEALFEIVVNIPLTQEELSQIQTAFINAGMQVLYTLEPPTT